VETLVVRFSSPPTFGLSTALPIQHSQTDDVKLASFIFAHDHTDKHLITN